MKNRSHHSSRILATGIAALLLPVLAPAATYYWDTNPNTVAPGNDLTEGGAGTWDTVTANFTTSAIDSSAVTHNVWSSVLNAAGKDTIIFGGTAGGAILVNAFPSGGQIAGQTTEAANNLTFTTTGYILGGTQVLRFVNNGVVGGAITVAPGVTATINNVIQGTGTGGLAAGAADGQVDTLVDLNGGGLLRFGGGNGSIGFAIATGTTVEQTGGSFSGFNLNTLNGTLRTTANNVLQAPSSFQDLAGLSTSLLDLNGTTQTVSTLGGTLAVTNSTSANSITLGLTLTANNLTHTGVISNGTGKIALAVTGVLAQGNGFNSSIGMATQIFAGSNTYTGGTSLGRATVALDFSNAVAPATNILYNTGFGTPTGDDGKLVITRPLGTVTVANSAVGTLANLTLTGKASTANSQAFSGLKLDTNGAASVLLNPNATANTVTLDFGASLERATGGLINFATTNATTALSASASITTTAGSAGLTLTDANGVAYATLGGRDWAAKNAGNTALTAATYTNATGTAFTAAANINAGTAAANGTNDTRLSANAAITTLRYANTNTRSGVNLGGNTLTTGGILVPTTMNDYAGYLGGGTLTSPGADVVLVHYNSTSNRQFAVDAVVANGTLGATGFTKGGTAISLLTENNTFTGALTAQQGGLIVTGTNTAGSVNINGSVNNSTGAQLAAHVTTGNFLQIGYGGTAGTIGNGAVNIGAQGLLAVKTSDNVTLGNSILGLGGVTQGGSGTTSLVSAATALYTYAGDTTVTAGTLKLDYAASNTGIINDQSKLVLAGGTVEFASAANTTHIEVVRETGTIAGASTITKTGTGTGRLRLNGFNDVTQAGATVNFTAASIADTDIANSNGISGTRARFTVGTAGAYDWMTQAGNADSPVLAYAAYTALAAASSTNTANFLMNTPSVTLTTAAALANTVKFDSTAAAAAQTLTLNTTLALSQGGILAVGANDITITGGTLSSLTGTNSDLIVHQWNTSANGLTIASVIANGNGVSTLTKSGTGSLTLSGANAYTGQSFLNGGTTLIAANTALGAPASGQQINFNGGTLRATADIILSNGVVGTNNRNVVLNGVGGTLEVDATRTLTVAGNISGPGGLTKTGAGILDVRSAFNTGPTTVTGGTLKYGAAGGGNGYSALTIGAAGTVDLGGFATIVGTLAGTGLVTNSGAVATLTVGALPFDTTFSGTIVNGAGAVNFDKTGAGILILSGANTYTGSTVVSGGSLILSGPAALSDSTTFNLSSATATADLSGLTAASETVGSLAGAAGSVLNLGGKGLIAGGDNTSTTFAGAISGAGGALTKTATTIGSGTLTLTGVNSYTGPTTVDQGTLRIRDSVLVNTNGPLGNASSAVVLGTATSLVGGAFATNILLNVQPVGDADALTFARPIDFSQAQNNGTNNDRNRLRLESNATGGADTSKLTVSGDLTFGNHSAELYIDRAGQTLDFTGNINGTGTGTIYLTGLSGAAPTVDGAGGGTFHFSNVARTFAQNMQLTVGRVVIDGSVGAVGTNSPIGRGTLNFSDGNGGNVLNTRGRDAIRAIFLETAGTSYARFIGPGGGTTVTPTAGAQQTLYGTGGTNLFNGEQFGGLNTSGTVTFTGGLGGQTVNVSVTGTAGGLGGTNPVTTVHNIALIAQTGGTASFTGAITGATNPALGATGTPGAAAVGNSTRLTINQFRNHPNLDENRDGVADVGLANELVGAPTGGTVVLTAANTYSGGTEILGGTLNVNSDNALGAAAGALAISNNAILQAAGDVLTAARTLTLGPGGGTIDTNGTTVTFDPGSTITGSATLTKTGAGKLLLAGTQTYSTLTTMFGRTDIASPLGAGTSTINANAATNISTQQSLAALNIGPGAIVTFGALPPSPELAAFSGASGGESLTGAAVVPEPGSVALLAGGWLTLLGLRRRRA